MGRTEVEHKSRLMRPIISYNIDKINLITTQEMAESVRQSNLLWACQSPCDEDPTNEIDNSDGKYGNWFVSLKLEDRGTQRERALQLIRDLKSEEYPDYFQPPILLGAAPAMPLDLFGQKAVYNPNLLQGYKLFDNAISEIEKRLAQLQEEECAGGADECEGAVGYDKRYYETSVLLKPLMKCCPKPPYVITTNEETTWMGGIYCLHTIIEPKQPPNQYMRVRQLLKHKCKHCSTFSKLRAGIQRQPKAHLTKPRLKRPKVRILTHMGRELSDSLTVFDSAQLHELSNDRDGEPKDDVCEEDEDDFYEGYTYEDIDNDDFEVDLEEYDDAEIDDDDENDIDADDEIDINVPMKKIPWDRSCTLGDQLVPIQTSDGSLLSPIIENQPTENEQSGEVIDESSPTDIQEPLEEVALPEDLQDEQANSEQCASVAQSCNQMN